MDVVPHVWTLIFSKYGLFGFESEILGVAKITEPAPGVAGNDVPI